MVQDLGAGELVLQNIDREGTMTGYDIDTLSDIAENIDIPVIAMGGCGNIGHIETLLKNKTVRSFACGSFFVYKGPLRGVLINYPSSENIKTLNNLI